MVSAKNLSNCLGIITARSGSKGVPDKNIRDLAGKPMINYAVEVGLKCKLISTVMVTTDDAEIATIAKKAGAEVPFLRPKKFAEDTSRQEDAVLHAMDWYEKNKQKFEFICLLQPTEPLRSVETLDKGFKLLLDSGADGIMSVIKSEANPTNTNLLPADGTFNGFLDPQVMYNNRQEAPDYFRLNGLVAISKWDAFRKSESFNQATAKTMIVDSIEGLDVDNPVDFILAEYLIEKKLYSSEDLINYLKKQR